MAVMIPDHLPANASQGERNAFALLQKLPDDCVCYYEPIVGQRYPDFVVIIPELGVLIIEVKGWFPSNIVRADTHSVVVNRHGAHETHKHPVRQARDYMFELMNACKASKHASHLVNHAGDHAGRFVFPFGHVVFMSNIKRSQIDLLSQDLSRDVFDAGKVFMRDEMQRLLDLSPDALIEEMRGWFNPQWRFPRLSQSQVDAIRLIIHPEIVIEGAQLAVLDHKQEAKARSIGDGHRLIYGVAGSGKTVVLLARARILAKDAGKRVLVLCFNRELARRFQSDLSGHGNVDALSFHAWAWRNGVVDAGKPDWDEENIGNNLLQQLSEGRGDAGLYDAVLIDEAQDFHPLWFACAKRALKQPDDGDLLIALDGGQNLYDRKPFTWGSVGVRARGRVISRAGYDFDRNYRNTRQILSLAATFATVKASGDEDDALQSFQVDATSAVREGPVPRSYCAMSRDAEMRAIVNSVEGWLENGVRTATGEFEHLAPDDIAILYPRAPKPKDSLESLRKELGALRPLRFISSSASAEERRGTGEGPALTVGTIKSAKGLQFKAVILMCLDLLESSDAGWRAKNRAELYVGLTRATTYLCLSWTGSRLLTQEIESTIASIEKGD